MSYQKPSESRASNEQRPTLVEPARPEGGAISTLLSRMLYPAKKPQGVFAKATETVRDLMCHYLMALPFTLYRYFWFLKQQRIEMASGQAVAAGLSQSEQELLRFHAVTSALWAGKHKVVYCQHCDFNHKTCTDTERHFVEHDHATGQGMCNHCAERGAL